MWSQPFLQGALVLISGRPHLDATAWEPGVLCVSTLSISPRALSSRQLLLTSVPHSTVRSFTLCEPAFPTTETKISYQLPTATDDTRSPLMHLCENLFKKIFIFGGVES